MRIRHLRISSLHKTSKKPSTNLSKKRRSKLLENLEKKLKPLRLPEAGMSGQAMA